MKKFLLIVAVLVVAAGASQAQLRQFYIGPSVVFKGGINAANIPDGYKTAANFNGIPDIGFTFRWMFDKNSALGLCFDGEYATYSFRMRPESEAAANDNNTYVYKPSYITISPGLFFSGVTLNLALNIPSGINVQTVAGNDGPGFFTYTQQDLNSPNLEIRLGGQIMTLESETGHLNIVLRGGYMLTGVLRTDAFGNDKLFGSSSFNPNVASVGLGVNYLFDLGAM